MVARGALVVRREIVWAAAAGYGGRGLSVETGSKLIVVITAGHNGDDVGFRAPRVLLNRNLLLAVKRS
jgi:N-acetylmuramoyl-L-alanine amidase